jgi:hypothetical protein
MRLSNPGSSTSEIDPCDSYSMVRDYIRSKKTGRLRTFLPFGEVNQASILGINLYRGGERAAYMRQFRERLILCTFFMCAMIAAVSAVPVCGKTVQGDEVIVKWSE